MSKIDSDTRNTTVKRLAALKTFPTCIEVIFQTSKNKKSSFFYLQDNSSENKEENLANACYDQATYHVRGEEVSIETPFVITTNIEARSERAGDREILIVFEIPTATQEEMTRAEEKVLFFLVFIIYLKS